MLPVPYTVEEEDGSLSYFCRDSLEPVKFPTSKASRKPEGSWIVTGSDGVDYHYYYLVGSGVGGSLVLPNDETAKVRLPVCAGVLQNATLEQIKAVENGTTPYRCFLWFPQPNEEGFLVKMNFPQTNETLQRAAAILRAFRMGVEDSGNDREGPYVSHPHIFGITGQLAAYEVGREHNAALQEKPH